jgi:hypothetical protein
MFESRVHLLDLIEGSLHMIGPNKARITQAISVRNQMWIEGDGKNIELSNANGEREIILEDYGVVMSTQPIFDPDLIFLPSGKALIFLGSETSVPSDKFVTHIYYSKIINRAIQQPETIYLPQNPHSLSVSPNSQLLAFVEESEDDMVLRVLDLRTRELFSYQPWKGLQSYPRIVWSPDSKSLALSFMDQNQYKLINLDSLTGDWVKLSDDVDWVVAWVDFWVE